MSLDVSRPITRRELVVDYISPLVCEELSGQSGSDVEINILPFDEIPVVTGVVVTGESTFSITWNLVNRGLCYNVYRSLGPDGPYQLISSCQTTLFYDDNPGPGSWYYKISTITPEGEGPLSTATTTSGGGGPGPTPGSCPAESGTATPDSLINEENTLLGTVVPDPTVTSNSPFGTFDHARYKITYTGGAYKDDNNPCSMQFKFGGYTWYWNGGSNNYDPDGGGVYCGVSQGDVEVQVPVGLEREFEHTSGSIGVSYARFGTATNPVAGSPNPTFTLHRTGTYPTLPTRVRIQGYSSSIWSGGSCAALFPSADPEWDGVLDSRSVAFGSNIASWRPFSPASILGGVNVNLKVEYIQDHPTSPTGCGWRLSIESFAADASGVVTLWTGIKGIDLTPVGRFYREDGCKTGPECLIIEEF